MCASGGRTTALLAEGLSVLEIAAATDWQPGYVRRLLKPICRKQGLSGQVSLVPRVLALETLGPGLKGGARQALPSRHVRPPFRALLSDAACTTSPTWDYFSTYFQSVTVRPSGWTLAGNLAGVGVAVGEDGGNWLAGRSTPSVVEHPQRA